MRPRVTAVVILGSVLALAPLLLHRGFALVGDMSFVPFQPWKGEWLGLDGTVPRAVPADAVVSVLTHVVPGDLVQKAILLGSLVLAGSGVLQLLRRLPGVASMGAALLYVWNPYVYERLAIGHWGLLVGYGALPWVLDAALGVRAGRSGASRRLLLWLAVAAVGSPTGGVLAVVTAVVVVASRRRRRRLWVVLASGAVANLPWLVPALLTSVETSDPAGVAAFSAAADSPMGLWGSLLGLGGIWKESVVPDERSTVLLGALAAVVGLTALAAVARSAVRSPGDRAAADLAPRRLLVLGVGALLAAGLPGTAVGGQVLEWLVSTVPGAGLLRDSQKLLMPFALVVAVGFGLFLDGVRRRLPRDGRFAVPALLALLPVLLLPTLGWGLAGRLEPVQFPREWTVVRAELEQAGAADDRVLVLPWAAYRSYPWNEHRAVLDPAIRFFPGEVLTDQDLVLDDVTVRGDDPTAAVISAALDSGSSLEEVVHDHDVRWVLVEKGAPLTQPLPGGTVRHDGAGLLLLETDVAPGRAQRAAATDGVIVAVDVLAGLVVAGVAGTLLWDRLVRRRSSQGPTIG